MTYFLLRLSVMLLLCGVILASAMIAVGKTLPSGGQLLYGTVHGTTLYALDLNSGISAILIRKPVQAFSIVLSPDGTELAFLTGDNMNTYYDLVVMNVDGTHVRHIEGNFIERPQWLPNSTQLMIPNGYDSVALIDVFDLTTNELALPVADCHWFDLSPDGQHIVFYKYTDTTGRCDLHIIDVDGSNFRRLPFEAYPSWSPDSRQLVIPDQQSVFLIDIDNLGNTQTVFPNPAYRGLARSILQWSTDNTQIIFVDEQSSDIYTLRIHPDIGSATPLNLPTQINMAPIWSPNDQRIAFLSMSDWEIYIANADGTNLRRITYNDDIEMSLLWLP